MSLIDLIMDESNIRKAICTLKTNKGSKTPGVNGETISDIIKIEDEIVKRIKYELKGKYTPGIVKRVEIPKGDGSTRPLGIPEIYDRLVQLCIKQILEPIVDKEFYHNSYGFRPNRSTEHAIAVCYQIVNISKLYFVVDIDIKGFFDNINHKKLIKQLQRFKVIDKKTLSIIKCILKVETLLPNREIVFSDKGTPQGGILSPLLANIVLNELDWLIHSQWLGIKTRREYSTLSHKVFALKKTKLTEVRIIRYADDFYIHWKIPKEHRGTDDINNIMILHFSFKAILNDENKADYYKDNKNYQNLLKALSKYK